MKAKRKKTGGRPCIPGLRRITLTLTDEDRKFFELLSQGKGLVAGIREARRILLEKAVKQC